MADDKALTLEALVRPQLPDPILVCKFCGDSFCLSCLLEGDLTLVTKEEYEASHTEPSN